MSEIVTLKATIPTHQYANLQPEIVVEAETYEEALATAELRMRDIWNRYVEGDKKLAGTSAKRLKAFVGGEIDYDEQAHAYTWEGVTYLSGSQYAKQFEKPFDSHKISEAMATKWGVDANEIRKMWELKAEISRGLGTMIHSALELYGRYDGLATKMEKTTNLHDHPIVKKAVESFYATHKERAEYEALIVDHKNKRAGQVDRLVILGDKKCRVEDYKCNAELTPDKLNVYWKQLEFYSEIMEANGWKCEPPIIHHWDGNWKVITKDTQ